jgi:hypothetical protein
MSPDKNIVPFKGRARRSEPLTADERWFDQLIRDFGGLPVAGQLDVIFAACDDDAKAQIAERLVDYLNYINSGRGRITRRLEMNDDQTIARIAADMFNSETRRGWLANKCSWIGDVPPDISEEAYIARFVEKYRDTDIGKLEEMADFARPSNMPTAYERENLPIVIAKQKGWDAHAAGKRRKELPAEYRTRERAAEADGWLTGWDQYTIAVYGHDSGADEIKEIVAELNAGG